MRYRSFAFVLLLTCVACNTATFDEKIIADNRNGFNLAIASHDLSNISEFCADDITVITSRNARFIGKDQYAAGLEQDFKSKADVIYIRVPEMIEVFPGWGMAAESGQWTGKWKNGEEAIEVTGTYYAKWKMVGGKWLINAEVFTPLKCIGGAYCNEQ